MNQPKLKVHISTDMFQQRLSKRKRNLLAGYVKGSEIRFKIVAFDFCREMDRRQELGSSIRIINENDDIRKRDGLRRQLRFSRLFGETLELNEEALTEASTR